MIRKFKNTQRRLSKGESGHSFIQLFAKENNIKRFRDWESHTGSLSYGGVPGAVFLSETYPIYSWYPSQSRNFSTKKLLTIDNVDVDNFLNFVGSSLRITTYNHWYSISDDCLKGVLWKSKGSKLKKMLYSLLRTHYIGKSWKLWLFEGEGKSLLKSLEHRDFFDSVAQEQRISTFFDWYSTASRSNMITHRGAVLLKDYYSSSPYKALVSIYHEYKFLPWMFDTSPRNIWGNSVLRSNYMDWLSLYCGTRLFTDLYKLSSRYIRQNSGRAIFRHSKFVNEILLECFPEYTWRLWKFETEPHNTWSQKEIVYDCLCELSKELLIKDKSDWYRIDNHQIRQHGAKSVIVKNGGICQIMMDHFSYLDLREIEKLNNLPSYFKRSSQRLITVLLSNIFPHTSILEDVALNNHVENKVFLFDTGSPMIFDIWIPQFKLVLEYQGNTYNITHTTLKTDDQVLSNL
eukprot:TRINITY_DN3993_c0_g1_i1.p1 TRINITY_DN3993_c0_g1~~TRINITY_DN3993_c0_g1_i1.p1  ORF type:complete len:460 (+),score=9.23 TRINITY_DN3993_c0_g1_i1:32-1411(+)